MHHNNAIILHSRITRAIEEQEKFRVFVVIPVYPAGDITTATTKYLVKYTYKTINRDRGPHSIIQRILHEHPEVNIDGSAPFFVFHYLPDRKY
jgi:hypothetical protein